MLKNIFTQLVKKYTSDNALVDSLWNEIERHYSDEGRHYHTLSHLDNLFQQLSEVRNSVDDWDTLLFSLFYHDIIYNAIKKDNEEKSAELGKLRLQSIGYSADKIEKCVLQILATKAHITSADNDINLFTDADLSILGQEWSAYSAYSQAVRKEYSIYPNILYNPGRKKVLQHFLAMERIFKTTHFFDKFEMAARQNLKAELNNY